MRLSSSTYLFPSLSFSLSLSLSLCSGLGVGWFDAALAIPRITWLGAPSMEPRDTLSFAFLAPRQARVNDFSSRAVSKLHIFQVISITRPQLVSHSFYRFASPLSPLASRLASLRFVSFRFVSFRAAFPFDGRCCLLSTLTLLPL